MNEVKCQIGDKEIVIETGKIARQTDGSVIIRCGDTTVLVTAVSQTKIREGQDFFPLSVEYKEKAAAAGQIPGGYFKREGRPTEREILICRMTDRPLRSLFPKGYFYDTQIIAILLSADGENDPDTLCMNGASAALTISDIPFDGPMGAIRVGRIEGKFIANPSFEERQNSDLDLVFSGTKDNVIMIEGAANEIKEEDFSAALDFAQENIKSIIEAQEKLKKSCGKEKRDFETMLAKKELLEIAYKIAGDKIESAIYQPSKVERNKAVGILRDEVSNAIIEKYPETNEFEIDQAFDFLQKKAFRKSILEDGKRADGRGIDQLRPLSAEVGILPRVHGSALFSRGETQALSLTTLAPLHDAQSFDNYAGGENKKRFILHYNFPPFSVNETGRVGGINRREIGHGSLAERSINAMLPDEDKFPYAIRVSSEVMESNGSTSMASVCSGSMSLMHAGVPLKDAVAGVSVGLVSELDEKDKIKKYLTILDIIGSEDFFGDMDFKLCGTKNGVTGFQLDLKLPGIPLKILHEAIEKAKQARMKVLEVMNKAIEKANELSPFAPQIVTLKINPEKIGSLIGPGGKNIRNIQESTGTEITVEDTGTVHIYAKDLEKLKEAEALVDGLTAEIELNKIYHGKVISVLSFGAFVEVLPGQEGLVHISELAEFSVGKTEDILNEGDMVYVKCIGFDDRGKVKLSRKAAMRDRGETDSDELRQKAYAPKPSFKRDKRSNSGSRRSRRGKPSHRRYQ